MVSEVNTLNMLYTDIKYHIGPFLDREERGIKMAMEEIVLTGKPSKAWLVARMCWDVFMMMFLIGIYWCIRDAIKYNTTKLKITTARVSGHTGLVNTDDLECPLRQITGVRVQQSMLGKMFNYGTIVITTAANVYSFDTMQDPNAIKTALNRQIERSEDSRYDRQAEKIASAIKG